ncbi:hypothetical protein [Vreelandella populi]|uniref:hypothetical protein n=1 Tax=Vreelandella populi TaxID=2498858 RepID=UPI000F8DC334|nr:hypothetical protein [Halomonas populi]RUR52708.1 hypothetical protein ELY40_11700 [Halomonas populi]
MKDEMNQGEPLELVVGSISAPDHYALESAISSTAAATADADDYTAGILHAHLKELCALQLSHLERLADYDYAIATGLKAESAE